MGKLNPTKSFPSSDDGSQALYKHSATMLLLVKLQSLTRHSIMKGNAYKQHVQPYYV
jgi:hypothetical protein